ncbi:hypothetical protein ACRAWC_02370 [Leifsonia sp. L25]|uniref:hypothetical protein n=1 Tax=Actinomycetes TaxID=1760 RepID=UPI003D693D27
MTRFRRTAAAIVATMLAFALAGCAPVGGTNDFGGAVAPPAEFSSKTDRQTLDKALAHTDDLVQFLGGEWLDSHDRPFVITNNVRWSSGPCGARNSNQYSGLGYRVRQIGPTAADQEKFTEIVVDLPFGAGLIFNASTTGMGISAEGECIIEQ